MERLDFSEKAPGRLINAPNGYLAFIPADLPPSIEPSWELLGAEGEARAAVGELAGLAHNLPNPHLLITPFIRREAVLSSKIEGTQASVSDLMLFEAARREPSPDSDVVEVHNYIIALEYGLSRLDELPLSLRFIRDLHARLMAGVRGAHLTPGEFRKSQNWIGAPGSTLATASFVPPPVPEMLASLDALEKYLHAPSTWPPLMRIASIHYQFEAIHPFLDGNGRIGRLLITLLLCHERLLPTPLLYLSAYFERTRSTYYERLTEVSQQGAWEAWLLYVLHGMQEQARDAVRRAHRLLGLYEEYRLWARNSSSSALLVEMVEALIATPVFTVPQLARKTEKTPAAVRKQLDRLIARHIVTPWDTTGREHVFAAEEVLRVLNDSSTSPS